MILLAELDGVNVTFFKKAKGFVEQSVLCPSSHHWGIQDNPDLDVYLASHLETLYSIRATPNVFNTILNSKEVGHLFVAHLPYRYSNVPKYLYEKYSLALL